MKPDQLLAGSKAIRKWVGGLSDLDKTGVLLGVLPPVFFGKAPFRRVFRA